MPSKPAPRASDVGDKPKPAKPHPAAVQQKAYATSIAELELPRTTLVKLAKGSIPDNVKMQQDVAHALLRSSTVFISYLTHDQALERSGRSITAGDVIKAITEMDFGPADNLVPILEQELAAYRAQVAAAKKAKAAGRAAPAAKGKRKAPAQEDANDADVSMAVDGDDDDDDEDGGEGEGEGDEGEGEGEGEGGDDGEGGEGDGADEEDEDAVDAEAGGSGAE